GWGYTVSMVQDHVRADSPDLRVLELARSLDAVLLTVDLDFANILDYPPQDTGGLIVMRYRTEDEATLEVTLRQLLNDLYRDGLRGVLVIVSPERYRVRRG